MSDTQANAGAGAGRGHQRILIVGGGYVGLYTALRLQQKLHRHEAEVVLIDPQSYMTYQPFLPEAAAGNLEPRHVVVPLRRVLPSVRVINGRITDVRHRERKVRLLPNAGDPVELTYDHLVMAVGSVARTLPIPGLADCGIGFKTVAEAIYLRNHVLAKLDIAASTNNREVKRRALSFVFVGGGYAGIEALGELEDMAHDALEYYPELEPSDMRWVLVEASDHILPEVGADLGRYTVDLLRRRGIDVRLNTRLESARQRHVVLSDGEEFDADTLVWTAGVKPHPLVKATDLPVEDKGRIKATACLTVDGVEGVWTAGDCAAVPDLTQDPVGICPPNAQHAVRQARQLGDNLVAALRGEPLKPYVHKNVGSVASLGLHQGVAAVYGRKFHGWPAWFMHRTYHMTRVPTLNRKIRVVADWTLALFFKREIISLGELQNPREEFEMAARPPLDDGRLEPRELQGTSS